MHCYPYWGMPPMYLDQYESQRRLMDMYPDVYNRIHPRVQELCHHLDVPSNPRMYPYVEPRMLEEMVGQIYETEINMPHAQQYRGILRDLITVLFIRELIGRRRRGPFTGYPGYPGYGPYNGIGGFY
ncbi:hypothetical protein [Alkaliphilus serpentinus]|uniref:Uncharacterized protein n=1 Tax=Alkaliphilus serpentinus TaxID=1482731 RepID=A0A833HQI0_9FIRM|nr:hypothetical protein [Alkaliphilus serpentinus]KAB3531831.1 hypothetical protein F8153_03690 [Alkaliphilus serpentinus]